MIRPLAILGPGADAGDMALRRVLRFKGSSGPLVVLDWIGRGAPLLHPDNEGKLSKRPVIWCDLANRQRPVSLFRLERSERLHDILSGLLEEWRMLTHAPLGDQAIAWASAVGIRLAAEGPIGLGALRRTLARPEVRRWFPTATPQGGELGRLVDLITWALRFPAIFALSEGPNHIVVHSLLRKAQTLWIEIPAEHFEEMEHRLVCSLVNAVLWDALWRVQAAANPRRPETMPTVLHLFPSTASPDLPGRLKATAEWVRHVGIFQLTRDRPLSRGAAGWLAAGADVWVVGEVGELLPAVHASWVPEENQRRRLATLRRGEVWTRCGVTGRTIVARVKGPAPAVPLPWRFRLYATRRRRPVPVRQMSTALDGSRGSGLGHTDLYQTLCDKSLLRAAWSRVSEGRKNSHGVDGVTIDRFKAGLESELESLSGDLTTRGYRCRPLRRIFIPKADGERRPLGVGCVRDRVVQTACLILLEPIFEPTFSHFSFAFRPHRNAHQALAVARSLIAAGHTWVVTADIEKCFDRIDHDVLLDLVARRVSDPLLLALIRQWLTADVLDLRDILPAELGVPQGDPLSPILANIYLDRLDKHLELQEIHFVRYADDILILTRGEEEALRALRVLGDFLHDPLHLAIKPAKTNHATVETGIDFLGFRLTPQAITVQPPKLERVLNSVRTFMTILGSVQSTFLQQAQALAHANALIRGFRNYFALAEEARILSQMQELDGRVEQMAHELLPPQLRDDPAWICRERFSLPAPEEMKESAIGRPSRLPVHEVYPGEHGPVRPSDWMVKDESAVEVQPPKPTLLIEDPGDEDGVEAEPLGVAEHAGRLYVMAHGSYVTVQDELLIVKKRKVEICRRPLDAIALLFLQGIGMNVSVELSLRCAERDIPVVLAPPVGPPMAVLHPIDSTRSHLRSRQALRRNDPDFIGAGLRMLAAKIGNQASVLRYFAKYRRKVDTDLHRALVSASDELRELVGHLSALDPCGDAVRAAAMGTEGHAAAIYWGHLVRLLPPELAFRGRNTRGATDPVNQAINYVYGILYGEVWRALVKVGLDPYFGIIHGSERDQGSMVFDLIEEFRAPFADRLVLGMIGRGMRPETARHGFLRTRIRRLLAQGFTRSWNKKIRWRGKMIAPAAILEHQAGALAKLVLGEGEYQPFRMRW